MKQVKSFLKIFSLGLLLVGGAACTGNFDEINRKEYEVTKDEQGRENYNIGSTLRGLQGLVVPTKEHLYQFIEALAAGPFAGYYGTTLVRTDKFETYNPSVDWQDKTYGDIFTESYPLYRNLQDQSDDPVALALAKLLRVAIMHRMTDMYGPIPYSKVIDEQGSVSLNVPYDSQEAVYKQMLKELDEVSSVLKENLTIGSEAFRKFDDVYYGDVSKWYKFANSLKLRMAIRMVYVDPTTAQQVALRARGRNIVRHHQHGQQIQQEAEHAHRGGQRLTGEIGDPRRLHVLEYLHAEVLYLRHVERRVLLHRVHDLRVYRREPLHHGDQLLHEHVAEQREQSHDDHGEADQAHRRREATLPAVSHHRDHQRLDRQRDEYRDDDIQHDGRYLAP